MSAVLGDPLHRVCAVGGRDGMPRSLGSILGGSVTRFLDGMIRGTVTRTWRTPGVVSWGNGVAVAGDGATLFVADCSGDTHSLRALDATSGAVRAVVGELGTTPGCFQQPRQVSVGPDGCVYVADTDNGRVQVLGADLRFHASFGDGLLRGPKGVCVGADAVFVTEFDVHRVSVFSRGDWQLRLQFGREGDGDGELLHPMAACVTCSGRRVAVTEYFNHRVSVFDVDGSFVRHVGSTVLLRPMGIAASAADELVVADYGNTSVRLFGECGELLMTFSVSGLFTGVAVHRRTVFALTYDESCIVFGDD